jgi:tetraacyldisaccharide 4'-kinase
VSRVFGLLLQARAKLYKARILKTRRLQHPVISVGNLTVGGTGKTPLVIALAGALRDRGFHPVILSRGYGRASRGVLVVRRERVNWKEWGDEPLLMKERLGDIPVLVGANRYEAGTLAEEAQLGNLFLLDDGFQHCQLHRDVDLVTIDPVEWAAGELLLPSGPWREPKAAIARAHAACVQEHPGARVPDLPIPEYVIRTEIDGIYQNGAPRSAEEFRNRPVVAFAGIAKPERFFSALESIGIHPVKCVRFRDHHSYTPDDIRSLGSDLLITTEKDAMRLHTVTDRPYSYLRISAKIPNFDGLMSLILSRLPNC